MMVMKDNQLGYMPLFRKDDGMFGIEGKASCKSNSSTNSEYAVIVKEWIELVKRACLLHFPPSWSGRGASVGCSFSGTGFVDNT